MASRRLAASAAFLLLVSFVALSRSATPSAHATTSSIGFGSPTIVNPVHTFGEPDVRIAPDGTVYSSGPWGTGTQRSIWDRSVDGGKTFRPLHEAPISSAFQSDTQITGPGGGDTELAIDHTGKVYYADLAALLALKTATWDNASRTMQVGFAHNGDNALNGYDRQWFALWDPPNPSATRAATGYTGPLPVNYLMYAEAVAGCCEAATYSTDGVNYGSPTVEYSISDDGPTVIDQQTGTVFQAVGGNDTSQVAVAILTRDPTHPSDPSLTRAKIVTITNMPNALSVDDLFPVIAIDSARNLYVAWVTRCDCSTAQNPSAWQTFYSYSTAASGWTTWSAPRKISSAPSNTGVMPWAVAGTGGRLAVVWYGTSDGADNPSTNDSHQSWNVYLSMVTNAASSTPTVTEVKATPHPMHYGTICLEGLGCIAEAGNRNLADFFEVTADPSTGAVVIVYDDTSNELTENIADVGQIPPPIDGSADHRGAPVVTMIRQNSGVGLFGTTVAGPSGFGTSMTDPAGDALFDPVYGSTSVPEMDLRALSVSRDKHGNVVFKLKVTSLDDLSHALSATGSAAVDWVIRFTGPQTSSPTGVRNPIDYAAVEFTGGSTAYFAGVAQSVELCSVSGCFPHLIEYPRPPYGGTAVTGSIVQGSSGSPDTFVITVPPSLFGGLPTGSLLESLSAYAFARDKSAAIPITNTEAEGGVTPIEVDGVCCVGASV